MIDKKLKELLENATTKEQIAKLLGYKYFNGRIGKLINIFQQKNNIEFKKLGSREHTRQYKHVILVCPTCKSEFETAIGSKEEKYTCSRKCSNIYFSKKRSIDFNKKIKRHCDICKTDIFVGKHSGKNRKVYCNKCRKNIKIKRSKINKKYSIICKNCNEEFKTSKKEQMFCSRSCSSSFIMNEKVKNGTHIGWKSRKKLIPSYPEKYFMNVLDNENIKYEYEKPCGKYFIDFAIDNKMIALEIDGKQHNEIDRKKSDVKKDKFLKETGYKIFRIKWYNPISLKNKKKLYCQIDKLKQLIQCVG